MAPIPLERELSEALERIISTGETLARYTTFPSSRREHLVEQLGRCRAALADPVSTFHDPGYRYQYALQKHRHGDPVAATYEAWQWDPTTREKVAAGEPDAAAAECGWALFFIVRYEAAAFDAHGADHYTRFPNRAEARALSEHLNELIARGSVAHESAAPSGTRDT